MEVRFLKTAQQELKDAVVHYNTESEGLGYEFALEVKLTIQRIKDFPNAWHPLSKRARRSRTKRFPYGVVYQIRKDYILIVSVMHLHKEPNSWKRNKL